jgi:phage-related protein
LDWNEPERPDFHAGGSASQLRLWSDHRSDAYRCVYAVRFAGSIYVLHAFEKKSKKGRETPKAAIELIKQRLREAERIANGEQA